MKRLLAICAAVGLVIAACGVIPGTGAGLKIGMVTDIGQLEDKSFNEFSWKGVQDGAKAVGGTAQAIVTKDIADYKQNIQQFVDQKYDVIVTVGFLIGTDTLAAAKANPTIQFFGVDQFIADPVPANYQGLLFAEAQAGYLAGIVAGTITKSGKIGAVGGRSDVPPVVNYIKGYENGAKSVKSNVQVSVNYVEDFNAPDKGEASAKTMIGQGVDVLFQVAGLTGAGVLRAACNAKVYGIGVDVDQYLSLPDSKACIITSAEKRLQNATRDAMKRFKDKGKQTGNFINDATNDGIGVSEIRNLSPVPAGLQDKIKQATEDMKSGKLKPM
ncbi:MAG TPA: BMP family ABC transporter substrate-binding protein [Candidatus Limnocylindria bacterium]|jgi:basic membrane protein A|nr:BMP family ABC transporter substrate-binding protein [Candidatus Limnocylindria bacterium]